MFTGIVEELGTVSDVASTGDGARMTITAPTVADGMSIGDSIAVNGTCLTAVELGSDTFSVQAVLETLARTNLGDLTVGDRVNLERAMPASGRFDGHIVQGHVDATGSVARVEPEGDGKRLTVGAAHDLLRYVVEKGSITVDGVSLTVAALTDDGFQVALIPHTLAVTTLGSRCSGDRVNLEADILAKYIERLQVGCS